MIVSNKTSYFGSPFVKRQKLGEFIVFLPFGALGRGESVTHKNLRNYKLHSRVLYVIQLLVGPKISRVESLTYIFMVLITTRHLVHKHIEHGTGQNISKF